MCRRLIHTLYYAAACALLLRPSPALSQVTVEAEPSEISLLNMFVRKWSADSPLGDLREKALGEEDIEVRAWGGFGLGGTGAVVARRSAGVWRAWRVIQHSCSVWIPLPRGDSLTAAEIASYRREARENCGRPHPDLRAASIISVDTLEIIPLATTHAVIDETWSEALNAGLLSLPGKPAKEVMMLDGFHYVIELRVGHRYRATEFPDFRPQETETHRKVREVFLILTRGVSR